MKIYNHCRAKSLTEAVAKAKQMSAGTVLEIDIDTLVEMTPRQASQWVNRHTVFYRGMCD